MRKKRKKLNRKKNMRGSISSGIIIFLITLTIGIGSLLTGGFVINNQPKPDAEKVAIVLPSAHTPENNLQLYTFLGATLTPTPLPTAPPAVPTTPVMVDCGHIVGNTNEPTVLYAFDTGTSAATDNQASVRVWYNDEFPLTLGAGTISEMKTQPSDVIKSPNIGDQTQKDSSNLPYFPSLFLTDITNNAQDQSGDAESGGTPSVPDTIYGAWKPLGPPDRTLLGSCNGTDLAGGDSIPTYSNGPQLSGAFSNAFGRGMINDCNAEILWKIPNLKINNQPLQSGHTYRGEVVIHDGDREGDVGEACVTIKIP